MDCTVFVMLTPITYVALISLGFVFGSTKREKEFTELAQENEELADLLEETQDKLTKHVKTLNTIYGELGIKSEENTNETKDD
jgi:hypothetical protein